MSKKLTVLFVFAYLFLLKACGQTSDKAYYTMLKGLYQNTIPLIKPAALHQKLTQQQQFILLDARSKQEFAVSHLPKAQYIGYEDFEQGQLQGIPKDANVVVYCTVGYRSEKIGEKLKQAGYKNVYNLYGGIFEWINSGYAVHDAKGTTPKVHVYSRSWGVWLKKGEKVYE
ncbi:rhodanese-like domain-containing protein [Pontibacter cellulosilyticus]|uniref:Rhodanese-like domain-containing protein n=1 Tax=Pontibacter cellulosilyticus TaxID=1720253 RepID=A0A923N8Z9_9BACT|nr:rhodanese-like domain-containing protein [Pontibacter cellulosilyticus]MBC5994414.1 rhodanese-like domain-containing protein [Pontibacter cellulosilyticus]